LILLGAQLIKKYESGEGNMKIETKYHGEIEIQLEEIITFEKGIPGFHNEKKFAVLPFAEDTPFYIMQSTITPVLAFVLTDPFIYFKDYEFDISKDLLEELSIVNESDVTVYTILNVQEPFDKTTANLQAPVLINQQKGKQAVLNSSNYHTKHLLFTKTSNEKEEAK
jgi:flagellar assembly factor FliW